MHDDDDGDDDGDDDDDYPITIHFHLSLNLEGRWGTTDDFKASFLLCSVLTALWDLQNSMPIHSQILSSHFFSVCLVFFLFHCALQDGFGQT